MQKSSNMRKCEKAIFLSHALTERTPLYGGKKSISLKRVQSIKRGDSCNQMMWCFSNHAGTHIDSPSHFISKGLSLDVFKADFWVFKKIFIATIAGVKAGTRITQKDFEDIKDCEICLIKTGFEKERSKKVYWQNSPFLEPSLGDWLRKRCPSLRVLGIDFISISNLSHRDLGKEAHQIFLGNNILLLEDMRLSGLNEMPDVVIVAPLIVKESDGAPCTVTAIYN